MSPSALDIASHMGTALAMGSLLGLERTYHGRPAGFRTHALVCLASATLMIVTISQEQWLGAGQSDAFRTDPTRMAQGIMTGIGFLGAGVIFKDGFSVHGLTTAASIWITAAIGILFGIGLYYPGLLASAAAFGTLHAFRWIEKRLSAEFFAHFTLGYDRAATPSHEALRAMLAEHGFSIATMSYRQGISGLFEFQMVIKANEHRNVERLVATLRECEGLREFSLSPMGE